MVRVKLVTKYPLSYCVDREKIEVTADGKSGFVSVTGKPDVASDKFVVESEYIEVRESVSFGKKIPTNGLVLEFPIFEGAGTVLHDTSGNNNNGTIYGAVWKRLPTGKYVLSFDGKDDYIVVNYNPAFVAKRFTVAGWVLGRGFNETWRVVAQLGEYPLGIKKFSWNVRVDKGTTNLTLKTCNGEAIPEIRINLNENELCFFTFVFDEDVGYAYKNGEFIEEKPMVMPQTTNYDLYIGGASNLSDFWDGIIGMFLFYTRVLSEAKIRKIYKATAPLFGISP